MYDDVRRRLARPAAVFHIGGFRPPEDPGASWFGDVRLCAPGEGWPEHDGAPMAPICQVDVTSLGRPVPGLEDVALLAVFVAPEADWDGPNGSTWTLRAYADTADLVPLERPDGARGPKRLPMRPAWIEEDFPKHDDLDPSMDLPRELLDTYYDEFETAQGLKLGGWPFLVQSEIHWAPRNEHPARPRYVFQIDTCEKAGWSWGHGGLAYFGRGTREGHEDEWAMSWQCY